MLATSQNAWAMKMHHTAHDVCLKHPKLPCASKLVHSTDCCRTGTTQHSTPAWSDGSCWAHAPDVRQLGCWPAPAAAHVGAPCRECSTLQATGTQEWYLLSVPHEPDTREAPVPMLALMAVNRCQMLYPASHLCRSTAEQGPTHLQLQGCLE